VQDLRRTVGALESAVHEKEAEVFRLMEEARVCGVERVKLALQVEATESVCKGMEAQWAASEARVKVLMVRRGVCRIRSHRVFGLF
jgi:hypothetical protein